MVAFVLGIVAGVACMAILLCVLVDEHPQDRKHRLLQARGLAGQVFLIEPAPHPWLQCACMDGLPASLKVYGGAKANGVACVRCARSEITSWLLSQDREAMTDIRSDVGARA